MIGQRLLHYEIIEKIGEGGMGVVYKARDKHLNRFVAVKVLSADAIANPERKRRFLHEAQAASALNHPNIVHIYDVAESGGTDFIAMEYVEGRTLDAVIGRKGVEISDALKYAIQIADALARAHAAGIIHRDLKPANLMIDNNGLVKVLDFGLAKVVEIAVASDAATATLLRTEEGMLLGTVAYMSPEQGEGQRIDARSDIFSFGAVLYEMVTGRRAFQGASKAATLALVVHEDPTPPGQIRQGVPSELEKIISRCLRKDPERRFQNMADLKLALLDLKEESESAKLSRSPARSRASQFTLIAAGVALLAAAVTWWLTRPKATPQAPIPTALTHDPGVTSMPAISRDGKLLAYASDRADGTNLDIWVQQMAGGQPVRLTRHEAPDTLPDFSPDGTRIAFASARDGGGIYVVPTLGGEAEKRIVDAARATGPRFSPDGKWIAYRVRSGISLPGAKIFVVPATGGQPRQLAADFESFGDPVWSEDGRQILANSLHPTNPPSDPVQDWWAIPINGGQPVKTNINKRLRAQGVRYSGHADWVGGFFYAYGGATASSYNVWRIPLSSETFESDGDPQRLTSGTGREEMARFSAAGLLVFAATNTNYDMWTLPLEVNQAKVTGKLEQLTRDGAYGKESYLSRDGKKMAYARQMNSPGDTEIWIQDLESRKMTAVVTGSQQPFFSRITNSGDSVIYGMAENRKRIAYRVAIGGATPQKLCEDCCLFDMSSDETKVLSCLGKGPPPTRLVGWLDLASGKEVPLMAAGRLSDRDFKLSPDNKWIAFGNTARPQGHAQICVAPVRPGKPVTEQDWIPMTDGTVVDGGPRWSPDGRTLYFISERDGFPCVWARRFDPAAGRAGGEAFAVYHLHTPGIRVSYSSLSLGNDRLVLPIADTRSNIWMLKVP